MPSATAEPGSGSQPGSRGRPSAEGGSSDSRAAEPGAPFILVIEHEADGGLSRLGTWLSDAGARLVVARPYLGDALPGSLDGYDGLIVLGGSSGPLDDEGVPWLPATRALQRESIARAVPSLGVCLGAELLAAAVDGEVFRRDVPQIGAFTVTRRPEAADDPVFAALPESFATVLWHQEEVRLPPGAVHLIEGSDAPVQAFRLGECAWGTQFHPEPTAEQARAWGSDEAFAASAGLALDDVVAGVEAAQDDIEAAGRPFAEAFVAEVARRRG